MCRSATATRQAKRCRSQSDPKTIAARNERRRATYAAKKPEAQGDSDALSSQELSGKEPLTAIKLMNIDEAKRLIQAGKYETLAQNPYVNRLYDTEGNSMLYVSSENLISAITNDVSDFGMGYKLPVDKVVGEYTTSAYLRQRLQDDIASGDRFNQGYTVKDILYSNHRDLESGISKILSDSETEKEVRNRWFNNFGHDEQVLHNPDGTVAGYAYAYRPKKPVSLETLNPDLVRKPQEEGYEDYLWSKNAIEGTFQNETGDFDVALRDEYFTTMETMVRQHGHPKRGAYRIVFDRGDTVVKLPLNPDGISDNSREFMHSEGKEIDIFKGVPLAPCHLEYTDRGMPFLVMEKVDMVDMDEDDYPDWAHKVDAFQIGRSRVTGQLVAYDL